MEPSTPGSFKVLFSGASSFTGLHFVEALVAAGATISATFTRPRMADYQDPIVQLRLQRVLARVQPVWGVVFGDQRWLELVADQNFDLVCCHGARVGDYRSQEFSVEEAVAADTRSLDPMLELLARRKSGTVLLTGTYFERNEGEGTRPLRAFSPYGEAKSQTAARFQDRCAAYQIPLGKYVLPNPFGPLEKPNFSSYLARNWLAGLTPEVRTPDTIRDNLPVTALAEDYAHTACRLLRERPAFLKRNPSGGRESNLAFARRLASMLEPHLHQKCPVRPAAGRGGQHPPGEPAERYNTDLLPPVSASFWEILAHYYRSCFG